MPENFEQNQNPPPEKKQEPESAETPETGTEEQLFEVGQQVRVKRTSGEFEDDWIYEGKNSLTGAAIVSKKISDNRLEDLVKEIDINDLRKWQEEPTESAEELRTAEETEKAEEEDWRRTFTELGGTRGRERIEEVEQELAEQKKVIEEEEIKKAEDWRRTFTELGGTRGRERIEEVQRELDKEKEAIGSAEIPEEGIPTEEILKEAGISEPAESMTEVDPQRAVDEAKQKQEQREGKISALADVERVGKERLGKLTEGLSYLAALDKLGILGMRKGKELAIKGGKELAAIGLTPVAAMEEISRDIAGGIQIGNAIGEAIGEKIKELKKMSPEERRKCCVDLVKALGISSEKITEELTKGYDKIHKKGKISRLIERLRGRRAGSID